MDQTKVLHLKVNLGPFAGFVEQISTWSQEYEPQNSIEREASQSTGKYVCAAPVSLCMESFWDTELRNICRDADLVVPDGKPIVWAVHRLGHTAQKQVAGPDLMLALCQKAAQQNIPIGLYGGTAQSLKDLQENLRKQFPSLAIRYAFAPPFRPAGASAPETELQAIRKSGAKLLFVGIGCPKQEKWMAQHKAQLPLVMLGVGAAFLFHSGQLRRAPLWMRKLGLEWLFRLLQEPRRLFGRYLKTNLGYLWHTRCLSKKRLQSFLRQP